MVQNIDKLFAQCLTSVITAFGHQLVKAGRGHLNPGVEYEEDSRETSQQWLQMIAKKGVLLHMQSTLVPTNVCVCVFVCECVSVCGGGGGRGGGRGDIEKGERGERVCFFFVRVDTLFYFRCDVYICCIYMYFHMFVSLVAPACVYIIVVTSNLGGGITTA